MQKFTPTAQQVGLLVRGKESHIYKPGVDAQHADCILPGGAPVGFFGYAAPATGQASGSGSWNRAYMNYQGYVADYSIFLQERAWYVDRELARERRVRSMVLIADVTPTEASLFSSYWNRLKASPGSFHLLGYNCSTHASEAFSYAGILGGGIPGLDTPDNLYYQLQAVRTKTALYNGFVGFEPKGNGQFEVVIDA